MKTEEGRARSQAGPCGVLTLQAGPANFGRNLVLTFLCHLFVGVFAAYVSRITYPGGAEFSQVFRVAGAVGVAAYCLGGIPHGIFVGRTARAMTMDVLDGLVYGVLTGLVFASLWPAAGTLPST